MTEPVKPYEAYTHCNACGSDQVDVEPIDTMEHILMAAKIKCRLCWFEDYWETGHLESVSEIGRLNCKTYG